MAAFTAIMVGLAVAGAVTKTVGTIKAGNAAERVGKAQREASESQAELSDFNAQVADLQAKDAIARGQDEEQRFRAKVRGTIGAQRADFAAGNINVAYGSAVDVQADTAFLGELDALTIRTNAAREAWGYEVQSEDLTRRGQIQRKEGYMYEQAGKAAKSASRWDAAGSLIGTSASLAGAHYGFGRVGKVGGGSSGGFGLGYRNTGTWSNIP